MLANIKVALAGYVAEKVKFDVTATGVCSDFTNAMFWAHKMVWEWGMGKNEFVGDFSHIPVERLVLSSDCGMGREGMGRRHALYKMASLVQGVNIVRGELGLPEADCLICDPTYSLLT